MKSHTCYISNSPRKKGKKAGRIDTEPKGDKLEL